jgi:hypothetical protein
MAMRGTQPNQTNMPSPRYGGIVLIQSITDKSTIMDEKKESRSEVLIVEDELGVGLGARSSSVTFRSPHAVQYTSPGALSHSKILISECEPFFPQET